MTNESGVSIFKDTDKTIAESFLKKKIQKGFDAVKFGPVDIFSVVEQYEPGSNNFDTPEGPKYHIVTWWNKG